MTNKVPPKLPSSLAAAALLGLPKPLPPSMLPPRIPLPALLAAISDGTVRSPFPATNGPYFSGPAQGFPGLYDIDFSPLGYRQPGGFGPYLDQLMSPDPANKNTRFGPRSK